MRPLVRPGTPIAVVAPSGNFDATKLEQGLAIARAAGHDLRVPGKLRDPVRYLAASDEHRLEQLQHALSSEAYGAIWLVRGGFGLTRILHRIDWNLARAKPIIGFSDATPLLELARRRLRARVVHGPVLHSLATTSTQDRDALFALLAEGTPPMLDGNVWVKGSAAGRVVGGNLTMIASTCGTPAQPSTRGAILVLEDVGEAAYRIDRALQQLKRAGVFRGVQAVALGTFENCRVPDGAEWTLDDVIREHLVTLGVPVIAGLPFGHGTRNAPIVIGARAELRHGRLVWS